MQTKFEQLLDYLINEETEKANELFHQIVVEKSRGIYEGLISEEEAKDEDDKKEEDDKKTDENFGFEGGEQVIEIGGDQTDDLMKDVDMGDEGDEGDMDLGPEFGDDEADMGGEGDVEDRVQDLEDELEALKAEFEALMSGEEAGEEGEEEGEEGEEEGEDDEDMLREYTEQVGGKQYNQFGKMGDDGANTKSVVAGKNDMGGTASNIAQGGESKGEGTKGGLLAPTAKDLSSGNINVPGGKAGDAFKKNSAGHGAEKKGAGEQAGNTKSPLGSK